MNIVYVSSAPPQKCGIASYTWNLARSISLIHPNCQPIILSFKNEDSLIKQVYDGIYVYRFLKKGVKNSYLSALNLIDKLNVDIVHLQHEFGLFGGRNGSAILPFIKNIKKPFLVTFHSIKRASINVKHIIGEISKKAEKIIVHSKYAASALCLRFKIPKEKIEVLHHGVPFIDLSKINRSQLKSELGLNDRFVITNFGLINSRKGLEYAIKAVKLIINKVPNILFLILGVTHPNVKKREGEKYRGNLQKIISLLNLNENVKLVNRFMDEDELLKYLIASDIYVVPYPNKNQVSSGTLSYALSCGKPVISTPFHYAKEILGNVKEKIEENVFICQRGIIVPPKNPDAISKAIILLVKDEKLRLTLESESYSYAIRNMVWPKVAEMHFQLYDLMLKGCKDNFELNPQALLYQGK